MNMYIKFIAVICAVSLMLGLFPQHASSLQEKKFNLNGSYASVAGGSNYLSDAMVINIQDFHGDYETQASINKILDGLSESGKKVEIYLEGAYKEVDLDYLKGAGVLPQYEEFLGTLLRSGKVTGAEFFAVKNKNVKLNGLEDIDTYLKNLKTLSLLISEKDDIADMYEVFYEAAREKILLDFGKESKKLYSLRLKYENGKTDVKRYVKRLMRYAAENNINVKNAYPNVFAVNEMYRLGSSVNLRRVNSDLGRFHAFLKAVVAYKEFEQIQNSGNNILLLAEMYRLYSFKTPALTNYFQYLEYKESLNNTAFVREADELFWDIMCCQNDSSYLRQGADFLRVMSLGKKLIGGDIFSYEYERLLENENLFESVFQKYLGASLPEEVLRYYKSAKEFYAVNDARNAIFVKNASVSGGNPKRGASADIAEAFEKASLIKVMVTGGYHSKGLSELLDAKHISYAVLSPHISSLNPGSRNIYEENISIHSEIMSSGFQKFLHSQDMIIRNGEFNVKNFCDIMLDYNTLKFLADYGAGVRKEYTDFFTEKINEKVSDGKKIKSLDVDIISHNKKTISANVSVESADGVKKSNFFVSGKKLERKSISGVRMNYRYISVRTSLSDRSRLACQIYKQDIEHCKKSFELQLAFCKKSDDNADLEIIATEILQTASSLIATVERIDEIYSVLLPQQKDEIQKLIASCIGKYELIMSGSYNFGQRRDALKRTSDRLKKMYTDFGLENSNEDLFGEEKPALRAANPSAISTEISKNVKDYFFKEIESDLPVFAYAAKESAEKLGDKYDFSVADMIISELKDIMFSRGALSGRSKSAQVSAVMARQSREIMPYFTAGKFDADDQEEVENALIRSIAALEILAERAPSSSVGEMISLSEEMFALMETPIDIGISENNYLDALMAGKKGPELDVLKKELDDKTEYVRRLTSFQIELLKVISVIGQRGSREEKKAAGSFLIKIAQRKPYGMEGIYWIRQQAILRLKDFNSEESIKALQNVIERENNGEMSPEDSVFLTINLDASNKKTLSLKHHCSSVLIDFKRQDARRLIREDTDAYFKSFATSEPKDKFAFIIAASDVIRDKSSGTALKSAIFEGFSRIEDKEVLFAANILLDPAHKEFERHSGSTQYRRNIAAFTAAFIENLSNYSKMDLKSLRLEIAQLDVSDKNAAKMFEGTLSGIRNVLGNLGHGRMKNLDWIAEYLVYMISGGGVSEEIVRLENVEFAGNIAGLMSPNDDGGSTLKCRGVNSDKNGIYSVAQGDVVNFMTSAAALSTSDAPLKNIIKELMNIRFEGTETLAEALRGLKEKYEAVCEADGLADDFKIFWGKLEYYAAISDTAGFPINNNSLKNLIFESMAIDNMGYGVGFINPEGVYAAMKDFADLLGTKSIAVTPVPYGNITSVTTNGGVEYLGQDFFSHTPHALNGGMRRLFWSPHKIGEVFDEIPFESRVAKGLKNAKVIIAGLCSWITSLGVQIANRDVSMAMAENAQADKILITNPVKDDENLMTWKDSSVSFIERVSDRSFRKLFNTVFAWRSLARDTQVEGAPLTEKEVFEGKAGGYRGENPISVAGYRLLEKLKVKINIISASIEIKPAPRRDDPSKKNYKIMANPQILAGEIWKSLGKRNKELFYEKLSAGYSHEIRNSRFANATAVLFDSENSGTAARAEDLFNFGIDTFLFTPVSMDEAERLMLETSVRAPQEYKNVSGLLAYGSDSPMYLASMRMENTYGTTCYYVPDPSKTPEEMEMMLMKWFLREAPGLGINGLLKHERVSMIESSLPKNDFDVMGFEITPLKVLAKRGGGDRYDISFDEETLYSFDKYLNAVLEEFGKPVHEIAAKLEKFMGLGRFGDASSEAYLPELEEFLISIGAWDDVRKRTAMLYAIKYELKIKVEKTGIKFVDAQGKTLNFGIDATGKFQASAKFLKKMGYLAQLRVFADMDDNLAARSGIFSDEMRRIFADLTLYGICNPIVITGNTDETVLNRLLSLPQTVLRQAYFYTELGGLRYVCRKVADENGNTEYKFVSDDEYLRNVSKAEIPLDIRREIRNLADNADFQFNDLFMSFVENTHTAKDYSEAARLAFEKCPIDREMLELVKKLAGAENDDALIKNWQNMRVAKVKAILSEIRELAKNKEKAAALGLSGVLSEKQFLGAMKAVSLMEYLRISYSMHPEDRRNKEIMWDSSARGRILKGVYKKRDADSAVRVSLRPIRVTHVKDEIALFYAEKFGAMKKFEEFRVESSGRTTINILKKGIIKTVPIQYEIEGANTPSVNIMYSGDEVFLLGNDEGTAGIDDSVALLGLKPGNREMFVASTSLSEHDSEKRPNLVGVAGIMKKNGMKVTSPVDAGVFLHKMILERLEYNIGKIASDDDFEPENIIQLLKNTLQNGDTEFYEKPEGRAAINISVPQGISRLLAAA